MPLTRFWRYASVFASLVLAGMGSFIASAPASGSIAHQGGSPAISFIGAMVNSSTSVTFQAGLSPNGLDTTYVFNYGVTTAYGQATPAQDAGSGISSVMVTSQVTGLLPNTTYHYQVVATNSAGSTTSPDSTVVTTTSSSQPVSGGGTTGSGTTTTRHPRKPKPSAAASITIEGVPVATPAGGQSLFAGISCASTFCLAVGFEAPGSSLSTSGTTKPLIERWTGSSFVNFSAPTTPGASLYSIDCISRAYCLAVGRDAPNTYSARFTGRGWQVLPTPSPAAPPHGDFLRGVSCASSSDCWAVGDINREPPSVSVLVEHWNGSAWSIVQVPSPHDSLFNAVSCSSSVNCWAVGSLDSLPGPGSALAEHWNGRAWSVASVPSAVGPLDTVSCKRVTMCWVDGSTAQSGVSLRLVRGLWKIVAVPRLFSGLGISCTAVRNCLNVGGDFSGGTYPGEQWNGRAWIAVDAPGLPAESNFTSTACMKTGLCLLVGAKTGSSGNNYVAIGDVTRPA